MTAHTTLERPTSTQITPAMHAGELRILDTDLAARLGFDRPRKIRELIRRHKAALEKMGTCPAVGRVVRGNETEEFHLNKKQAIFITAKSETAEATAITIEIIERFDAYERGAGAPKAPANMREALMLALEQQEKLDEQGKELAVVRPKARALDELAGTDGTHNIRWSAAECQMREKDFVAALIAARWVYRDTRTGRLTVYARARDVGYMTVKNVVVKHNSGEREGIGQPMLTQKGLAEITKRLAKDNEARPFARRRAMAA